MSISEDGTVCKMRGCVVSGCSNGVYVYNKALIHMEENYVHSNLDTGLSVHHEGTTAQISRNYVSSISCFEKMSHRGRVWRPCCVIVVSLVSLPRFLDDGIFNGRSFSATDGEESVYTQGQRRKSWTMTCRRTTRVHCRLTRPRSSRWSQTTTSRPLLPSQSGPFPSRTSS